MKKEISSRLCHGELQAFAAIEAERLGGLRFTAGEGLLRDAVHGVGRIRDRSAKAKQHNADEEAIPRKQRHSGDKILDELLRSLAGTWFLFSKLPTTSVSSGTQSSPAGVAGGQFVAFVEACLNLCEAITCPHETQFANGYEGCLAIAVTNQVAKETNRPYPAFFTLFHMPHRAAMAARFSVRH